MKLNFKDGKANKVHIYVDCEYRMTVDRDFIAAARYYENCEINDEELAELEVQVSSRRAFNKAVDLLSRRDHASGELLVKLRQKGYADGAQEAIEKLTEYGYIDDWRFAENYAAELQRLKGFGKRRIEQELYKKGVSRDIISQVTDSIESDSDELADLLERKYGRYLDTEKGITKAINGLVRMGYGYSEIKAALEAVKCRLEDDLPTDD
ncbi:MAG: recombination regulator RecX [Faecalibacterium sp.]|nr:recombination regulator RecX [Ruminococcus sp.]MCM1486290.1 recombination regulator RecX [Faecalibacterium sp.]